MKVRGTEEYNISDIVDHSIFFTKDGALSYLFELQNPVKHSLSADEFAQRIAKLEQAFQTAVPTSYIHKQDIYLQRPFDSATIHRPSYLGKSVQKHYQDKPYTQHTSSLIFTLKGLKSLEKAYVANPFAYSQALHKHDREKAQDFNDFITRTTNILNGMKGTHVRPISNAKTYLFDYLNGHETNHGIYDLDYTNHQIGQKYFSVFAFNQAEYFRDTIPTSVQGKALHEGLMDFLGETLPYDHIYNQILYFPGKKVLLSQIERTQKEYSQFSSISPFFKERKALLEDAHKRLSNDEKTVLLAHFNLILLAESQEALAKAERKVMSLLDTRGIHYYRPRKATLTNCFRASVPGRELLMHRDFFFITDLPVATSLFTHTTLPQDDEEGIYYNEPISNKLLKRDVWDTPKKRMNARNGITIATTGGGKSASTLRKVVQEIEQGIHVIVVEFGMSFEPITRLYPDTAVQIKYHPDLPLGLNPFHINGQTPDFFEVDYIASIIFKCWRIQEFHSDTHVKVSMNKIIKAYYREVSTGRSFESFYRYVIQGGATLLDELDIQHPKYFDLDSFKHVCSEFIAGGQYENIFKETDQPLVDLKACQFVLFELNSIKRDPFLVTLILLLIQKAIDSNILADRGTRGKLYFDEFAETQAIRDLYTGEGVLGTVAVLFQKIRKETGAVHLILQDIAQLPDNEYTQSILSNTQIKEVLPSSPATYDRIRDVFQLSPHAYDLMCSLQNDFAGERPYSEQLLCLGDTHYEIVRNELSREEFLTFQTEGPIWQALTEAYQEHGDFQKAIEDYDTLTP